MRRHGGRRLGASPGEIVDRSGRVLGRHDGHHDFTVGQRRGLGVGGGDALYVLEKDTVRNRVVVGTESELAVHRVRVGELTLHRPAERVGASGCATARSRCRAGPWSGTAAWSFELERPARAVAPGQVACLLDGDLVVG